MYVDKLHGVVVAAAAAAVMSVHHTVSIGLHEGETWPDKSHTNVSYVN